MNHLNLVNFHEDPVLNGLRFDMGARLVQDFGPRTQIRLLNEEAIRRLGVEGIDIDDFSEIKVEHDRTLSYKGKRIVIYIRDLDSYKDHQGLPKFHFSYCRTLETMRQNKRWHRYVVANRDDGTFVVNYVGEKTSSKAVNLVVCQNCLEHIAWEKFSYSMSATKRQVVVRNFKLTSFFDKYPKDLLSVVPIYTVDSAPLNAYSDDWGMISEGFKYRCGYRCSSCSMELNGVRRKYLHVHHVNGQKNNNSEENLEVLCIKCHAEKPMHSHMKALKDYKDFISIP